MKELNTKKKKRPDYSDNIIKEFTAVNLSNFYERSKRELDDFLDIFQLNHVIDKEILSPQSESPYRILFLETLYTYRITVDECMEYQAFLVGRIKTIEEQIDYYFKLLEPAMIEKMKKKFDRDRVRRKKLSKEGTLKDQVKQRKYEEWFL